MSCASLLDVDGDYVLAASKTSPDAGAGSVAAGAFDASAVDAGGRGNGGSGGAQPSGCEDACGAGTKCCNGTCVEPKPLFGCSLTGCESCSLPMNAVGVCDGQLCSFTCVSGFVREGDVCVPSGAGGAPDPGPQRECDPAQQNNPQCTGCVEPIYSPCCQANGECGCAFPFAPCLPK